MNVVVTGAKGQVGTECVALGATPCTDDITTIEKLDADVVIHCAAMTDVDGCERDPEAAMRINAEGTKRVRAAAPDAFLVYVSTDYVFDGTKPAPYVESDPTAPINAYGRSKLAGEQALDLTRGAVVRTSWVCGAHGKNMVKTILRLLDREGTLRFVDDQRGHPTMAADLAAMLMTIAHEQRAGIWHVTNQGAVSWFEFAQAVAEATGQDPKRIEPITTAELQPPRDAARPTNSVLDSERLPRRELLPDFRASLEHLISNLRG